jgi:hypothetical protein
LIGSKSLQILLVWIFLFCFSFFKISIKVREVLKEQLKMLGDERMKNGILVMTTAWWWSKRGWERPKCKRD